MAGAARFWQRNVLHDIMTACIIMHNMIREEVRDLNAPIQQIPETNTQEPDIEMESNESVRFQQFLDRHRKIKDKDAHMTLRNALIDHL